VSSRPAAARRHGAPGRVRPLPPRRISGPTRPAPATAGAVASPPLPARAPVAPRRAPGALGRLASIPEHRLVDRILRSRAWIWLIGLALGGIVAMQVSLLELNTEISRAVESAAALERRNADLEAEIARLTAGERIRDAAAGAGMVLPLAGAVEYVEARPARDAPLAARTMRPASVEAQSVMANGGRALPAITPAASPAEPAAGTPAGATDAPGTTAAPGTVTP
jgi:cell division protein FtsL